MTQNVSTSLRLLVVSVAWPPETFLARLFQRLAARGFQVTIITTNKPQRADPMIPNVDVWHLPGWDDKPYLRLGRVGYRLGSAALRSVGETRHIYDTARSYAENKSHFLTKLHRWLPFVGRDWDVCYIPWNSMAVDYLPLMDFWPSVVSCRGSQINIAPLNPQRAGLRNGMAEAFEKASVVHCVSEAIRDEAVKYGLDADKSIIIRPAVDPERFRPLPEELRPSDDRLRIISTGSLNWIKGYEYALSAIRRLVDRGWSVRYEIIGDGPERQRLLYTIQDLELDDHVIWYGKLSPPEVQAKLQGADIFLLTSISEGISNAVLEGMSSGLPVVTTDVGGMSEAVTHGVEGFLTPSLDSVALADALEELGRSPRLRREMGAAGRARILQDFRLDDQADAFVELIRSVA